VAVLVLAAAATATASARSRKPAIEPTSTPTTDCYGTPIIMQGLDCPRRSARGQARQPAAERPERPRVTVGSGGGGYTAPLPRTPSLTVPPPSAPYIPPPVSNPSERVMQSNQSFPFNGGLGNNPTDRDTYIRYNLNR
jgi:hypothetical protein